MNIQNADFHITIGAAPEGDLSLGKDLGLIKAALLYADKVKLYSLTSSMALSMLLFREFNRERQMDFLESIIPILVQDEVKAAQISDLIDSYKRTFHGGTLTNEELLIRARFNPMFTRMWTAIRGNLQEMLEKAGMAELITVLETGLLEAHIFGAELESRASKQLSDKYVQEFSQSLESTLNDNTTYPLFDDETGNIVRLGLKEGKYAVSEIGISRGKHAGLAAQLLERLPLFEEASVSEILDIRH